MNDNYHIYDKSHPSDNLRLETEVQGVLPYNLLTEDSNEEKPETASDVP
jgi:hypothetical protein